ncbi:sulfatase-like hydrolase/transferase [Algoriphagus formosus]|uniref:Arylsulfatase A n=1 Tax=Algoriphagus formosus TaxID=2007308 RepID=A0A4R5V7B6_9BACT|nr:sulfatase-like hydrolase/transferase [Algoriphagus aquimaris]TDK47948.1 arylsulfatase A [Algoriphagus aquimaris]
MRKLFIHSKGKYFLLSLTLILQLVSFAQENRKPNIVFIMADDLGYETLGINGGESYQTPNLDRIARKGINFTEAYATPLCTPSRVQLMTGKYNFRNYIGFGVLENEEITFANVLKDLGYSTAIAGKWQLGGDFSTPNHFGFDQYCLWQINEGDFWYRYKNPRLVQNGRELTLNHPSDAYGPDIFTTFIIDFIRKNANKPFLVYYPMALVHDPFQPTPRDSKFKDYPIEDLNDITYFRSMVEYMDELVGRIYSELESQNLLDNTYIIFTGDNGTDRKVISKFKGDSIRGDKGYTTSAGTHVPLIISGPSLRELGQNSDHLVDFTDFFPTFLDIANGSKPNKLLLDGRSLKPFLVGEPYTPRRWIFTDYNSKGRDFPIKKYVQDKQFKLYSDGSFFNYKNDPQEKSPLSIDKLKGESYENYLILNQALSLYQQMNFNE